MVASNEARDLVRTVLDFQRDDSCEESLDIGETVESLFGLFRYNAPTRVLIEPQIERGLYVLTRRSDIQRILLNLVTNARRAVGDEGRIEVRVRQRQGSGDPTMPVLVGELRDETYVALEVEDDGCGIPEDQIGSIFEPFVTNAGGTGLGLATVREIVLQLDGAIRVESTVGEGTTFEILLPEDRP